jgi:hypothetical protein
VRSSKCARSRSLFEKDKLLFSFLLASRLMKASGQLDENEFRFLLTGGTSIGTAPTNECSWLADKSWAELVRLDQLPSMTGFLEGFVQEPRWHQMFESTEPFKFPFPGQWENCSGFQRLMIMRCIRPDKIVPAVMLFVADQMGQNFIEPPPFDLAACFEDSNPCSPLIFVLSAGADPNASLFKLAEEKGYARCSLREKELSVIDLCRAASQVRLHDADREPRAGPGPPRSQVHRGGVQAGAVDRAPELSRVRQVHAPALRRSSTADSSICVKNP